MELIAYWRVIKKSLWLIMLIVAISLGGTAAVLEALPTQYESTITLYLVPSGSNQMFQSVSTDIAASQADTYGALIGTRSFQDGVLKGLSFTMTVPQLTASVSTALTPNTNFFRIKAKMDDPERAQQLAGAVLKVFQATIARQQQVATADDPTQAANSDMRQRLETRLKDLEDTLSSYSAQISKLEAQPQSAQRDTSLQQLYNQRLTFQQAETQTMVAITDLNSKNRTPNTFLVVDQPLPGKALPRNLPQNLALAFAVAVMLGVGLAFLRDYLDYTVHSADQLKQLLGLTPLGTIGLVGSYGKRKWRVGLHLPGKVARGKAVEATAEERGLVTLSAPRSIISENFRVLRTNLQFSSMDKPIRKLLVTSSRDGEGKSFTAANLAIIIAQTGKRVILVDADLRVPRLHELFNVSNSLGFTNLLLSKSAHLQGAVQAVPGVPNLVVIPSGPLPPNPSEVLNSDYTAQIVDQLSQQSDIVIYDSPPAGVVTDATILATRMDAVILVIGADETRRDLIERVKESLQNVGVSTLLPVLNRARSKDSQVGYRYYSSPAGEHEPLIVPDDRVAQKA